MDRFVETAVKMRMLTEPELVQAIIETVQEFCSGNRRDDIAIAAVRFL